MTTATISHRRASTRPAGTSTGLWAALEAVAAWLGGFSKASDEGVISGARGL